MGLKIAKDEVEGTPTMTVFIPGLWIRGWLPTTRRMTSNIALLMWGRIDLSLRNK